MRPTEPALPQTNLSFLPLALLVIELLRQLGQGTMSVVQGFADGLELARRIAALVAPLADSLEILIEHQF